MDEDGALIGGRVKGGRRSFQSLTVWTFGEDESKLCRYAPKDNLVDISKGFNEFQRDVN